MKLRMALELKDGPPTPMFDRTGPLHWASLAILSWVSIWTFLFQHAHLRQQELIFFPVLSFLGLTAIAAAGCRIRFAPWGYWFGALLVYAALGTTLNPSVFSSWGRVSDFLLSVALGLPILLALNHAALGARILCGICIALSLAGVLDNIGFDVRAGIGSLLNSGLASGGLRIESVTNMQFSHYTERATSVWALFLAWIALAALRPATRRSWLAAASVFVLTALVIATGYSGSTKLIFVVSIGVFFAACWVPRFVHRIALVALLVAFLGAPLGAKAGWLWFTAHPKVVSKVVSYDESGASWSRTVKRRVVKRLVRWEYWAELIKRRPWTGLGFGAYWELPRMPFREVFGARLPYPETLPTWSSPWLRQKFVTSFPHNFPLHVWGELGTFGILLVTGFVASLLVNTIPTRPRDTGAAARVALLAAVLLVFGVDRSAWTPQNVIQFVLTAGLAAGTLTADARRRPPLALPGLTLRCERFLILAVLLIGLLVVAGDSARIRLADSRYTPEHTRFDVERGVLQHRGREIALEGHVPGHVDGVWRNGDGTFTVSGWAYDPAATDKAVQVLVFNGAGLLGATRTGYTRVDPQRTSSLPNLDLLFTGFKLRVSRPPDWRPQATVHAVFIGPSGSTSLAGVTDQARHQWNVLVAIGR